MIMEKIESRERCAEAGWYAYDYILDQPIEKNWIASLKSLGSFLYLPMLAKPFFKIEADHYMMKGIEHDMYVRVAVHADYLDELKKIEKFLNQMKESASHVSL